MAEHSLWETGAFMPSAYNEHSKQNVQNDEKVLDTVFANPSIGIVTSHVKQTSLSVVWHTLYVYEKQLRSFYEQPVFSL